METSSELERLKKETGKLKTEITELKVKLNETETSLKKYTNGDNHKRYYEKNKEKVMELGANYLEKLKTDNPDKLKEYRHRAYLKRKAKLQEEKGN